MFIRTNIKHLKMLDVSRWNHGTRKCVNICDFLIRSLHDVVGLENVITLNDYLTRILILRVPSWKPKTTEDSNNPVLLSTIPMSQKIFKM